MSANDNPTSMYLMLLRSTCTNSAEIFVLISNSPSLYTGQKRKAAKSSGPASTLATRITNAREERRVGPLQKEK